MSTILSKYKSLIIAIVILALWLVYMIVNQKTYSEKENWPQTTGQILHVSYFAPPKETGVIPTISLNKPSRNASHRTRTERIYYRLKLEYEYTVDGQIYSNSDYSNPEFYTSDEGEMIEFVNNLKDNAENIPVYYSPDSPDISLLSVKDVYEAKSSLIYPVAGAIFLCVVVLVIKVKNELDDNAVDA